MRYIVDPEKIEEKSFHIVNKLLSASKFPEREKQVAARVIHTTTDLDYTKDLSFHPKAIESGLNPPASPMPPKMPPKLAV